MIRKPTQTIRATVMQEIRQILPPEGNVPPMAFRRVQVLTPASPSVWLWITDTPNENVANKEGYNRGTYKGSPLPTNTKIEFELLSGQTIWAASESGAGHLSLVVEYLLGG